MAQTATQCSTRYVRVCHACHPACSRVTKVCQYGCLPVTHACYLDWLSACDTYMHAVHELRLKPLDIRPAGGREACAKRRPFEPLREPQVAPCEPKMMILTCPSIQLLLCPQPNAQATRCKTGNRPHTSTGTVSHTKARLRLTRGSVSLAPGTGVARMLCASWLALAFNQWPCTRFSVRHLPLWCVCDVMLVAWRCACVV